MVKMGSLGRLAERFPLSFKWCRDHMLPSGVARSASYHPRVPSRRSISRRTVVTRSPFANHARFFRTSILTLSIVLECLSCVGAESDSPPPAPPFAAVCFDDVRDGVEGMARLLVPVAKDAATVEGRRRPDEHVDRIAGLLRLSQPWPADHALRLSLSDLQRLQIYVWNSTQGIALCCHTPGRNSLRTWGAYGVTRQPGDPRPGSFALWATDEGRFERSGVGTFSLHCDDGELVMTRGDIVLLRVPFPGRPTEVYFDGQAIVRSVALVPCRGVPAARPATPTIHRLTDFAQTAWNRQLSAETSLAFIASGPAVLSAEGRSRGQGETSSAGIGVDEPGLCEYIFELEDPQAGTGIFLADEQGTMLCRVTFVPVPQKPQEGLLFAVLGSKPNELPHVSYQFDRECVPWVGKRPWFRLVKGATTISCFFSGDGRHWSLFAGQPISARGACRQVGLYCTPGTRTHSITLRSLEIRRLNAFASLVPQDLLAQVPASLPTVRASDWAVKVRFSQPADVPADVWRSACALQTLRQGPEPSLGQTILAQLLDDAFGRQPEIDCDTCLRLLDEAALLVDTTRPEGSRLLMRYHERLGERLVRRHDPAPFTRIRKSLLDASLATPTFSEGFPREILRFEVLLALFEERWNDVVQLSRVMDYWETGLRNGRRAVPWEGTLGSLLTWNSLRSVAETRSLQNSNVKDHQPAETATVQKASAVNDPRETLRPRARGISKAVLPAVDHPYIERISRDDSTIVADLEAAIVSHSYRDAGQLITSASPASFHGLVPSLDDSRRWMSLGTVIDDLLGRSDEFRKVMDKEFGSLGELRFRQATRDGDAGAVNAVAIQFPGSRAAADAHAWLGDRSLSAGKTLEAFNHYQAALRAARPEQQDGFQGRLRLAAAMSGCRNPLPAADASIAPVPGMSAADFERLISRLQGNRPEPRTDVDVTPAHREFPAGPYDCRPWTRCALQPVLREDWIGYREFQWASHQLSVALTTSQVILAAPTHIAVLDRTSGREVWHHAAPVEEARLRWPPLPMVPVMAGQRLILRRLTSEGIALAAFDLRDGRVLWKHQNKAQAIVSDPMWISNELVVLMTSTLPQDRIALHLGRLAVETGELIANVPLAEFRSVWNGQFPCQAVAVDDHIVVSAGGCVINCDLAGQVRWLYQQLCLPEARDKQSYRFARDLQIHVPPVVADGRVYVAQPGVWRVECLDSATGRLQWKRAEPELKRILGVAGNRVLVETADSLLSLDAASGNVRWEYDLGRLPDYTPSHIQSGVFDDPQTIVFVTIETPARPNSQHTTLLTWLDSASGRCVDTSPLTVPSGRPRQPFLGPFLLTGDSLRIVAWPANPSPDVLIYDLLPQKSAD